MSNEHTSVIHKYALSYGSKASRVEMPDDAIVVRVGMQRDCPHIWVMHCAAARPMRVRTFHVVGTGQEFTSELLYLGTVFDASGCVWHVLEATS